MKVCKDCKTSDLAYKTFVCVKTGEEINPPKNDKYLYCLQCQEYVLWENAIPEMFPHPIAKIIEDTKDNPVIFWKKYWFKDVVSSIKKDLPEDQAQSFFKVWIYLVYYHALNNYPKTTLREINSMCYCVYYVDLLEAFKIHNNIDIH